MDYYYYRKYFQEPVKKLGKWDYISRISLVESRVGGGGIGSYSRIYSKKILFTWIYPRRVQPGPD